MKKINYTQIAKDLNVTHSAVSQWFSGKTQPTIDKVFKMQKMHKIPVAAWKDIKSYVEIISKHQKKAQV
jgi:transcriptional regulator with XRE-family HTH domain